MGRLIPSGLPNQGHEMDFEYVGKGKQQKCLMRCNCGWQVEIESYRHPWSLIEIKVRTRKHMQELGLESNGTSD